MLPANSGDKVTCSALLRQRKAYASRRCERYASAGYLKLKMHPEVDMHYTAGLSFEMHSDAIGLASRYLPLQDWVALSQAARIRQRGTHLKAISLDLGDMNTQTNSLATSL